MSTLGRCLRALRAAAAAAAASSSPASGPSPPPEELLLELLELLESVSLDDPELPASCKPGAGFAVPPAAGPSSPGNGNRFGPAGVSAGDAAPPAGVCAELPGAGVAGAGAAGVSPGKGKLFAALPAGVAPAGALAGVAPGAGFSFGSSQFGQVTVLPFSSVKVQLPCARAATHTAAHPRATSPRTHPRLIKFVFPAISLLDDTPSPSG